VLAGEFDRERFLKRLRSDDQTRHLGDALLDQRNLAGIGNIWKAEGCWEAHIDPWRRVSEVTDDEAAAIIEAVRPRMQRSATQGHRAIQARVYGHAGRPCPRCGKAIVARGQGDANRTTYWCPGCQK
jgi:endonuclease-8